MDICDFTFRNEELSEHGYIICEFDSGSSASTVNTDSQRDIVSIAMFGGKYHPILYYTYKDSLTMELSICKYTDNYEPEIITPEESSQIKRWLSSPTPQELSFDHPDYIQYHWIGTFNVEEVRFGSDIVGFNLKFTCTAPFAYKDKVKFSGDVTENGTVLIDDTSDEEGYIYPDMTVTLKGSGKLTITNGYDGRITMIDNCVSGEVLSFSHLLEITSSVSSHQLGDDFNYKFIRINNIYGYTKNKLTFSLPCSYSISYDPIAKVVMA